MAQITEVKSFRGSSKNPELECEKCGTRIVKGDSYRHWSFYSRFDRTTVKHVICTKPECDPLPADLEGNPKRRILVRAADEINAQVDELMLVPPTSAEAFIAALKKIVLVGIAGADECADVLERNSKHRGGGGFRGEPTFIREAARQFVKEISVPPAPPAPTSDSGDAKTDAESTQYERDLQSWREECVRGVRDYARRTTELMEDARAETSRQAKEAFLSRHR